MQFFNMQSLGDNTLAAFLKADSFRTGETSKVDKSTNNANSTTNIPKNNVEDCDLGKYFKDSVVSFTKNADKSPKKLPRSPRTPKKVPRSPRTPKKSPRNLPRNRPALDIIIESRNTNINRNTENQSEKNDVEDRLNGSLELTKSFRNPRTQKSIFRRTNSTKIKKIPSAGAILASALRANSGDTKEDSNEKSYTINVLSVDINKPSTSKFIRTQSNIDIPRRSEVSSDSDLSARSEQYSTSHSTSQLSIEIPSIISSQDRGKLIYWGLPLTILRKYEFRGVTEMFPWQVECLRNPEIIGKCKNLVYSAPTSAGKTLVSEILLIKTVLERHKKVLFVLPFVSVVREKMYYFQDLLSDAGVRVEGFMGGVQPPGGFNATDIAIATIEKANSLINQLMEEGGLENLGAVVIDELHLLGDSHRGYLLELLLVKLKYMNLKEEHVNIQLIGMSATLPNLHVLANWLDAELYKTDFRPVPLQELCKIGSTLYDSKLNQLRELSPHIDLPNDPENIFQLCLETILDSHSVLIFCPSKKWCESLAQQISAVFCKLGHENKPIAQSLRNQLSKDAIIEILEQLKRTPVGLDKVLKATVSFGVAFHHAGLTMDERDVIEGAFRSGALRVLTATSTLSSGVNLPARRVIIRTPMFHGQPIDTLTYKQMIGRAGRMGKDTAGESILMSKSNERNAVTSILKSDLKAIESCLEGISPLIRALLEAVASEVAYTLDDITMYMKCTLLNFTNGSAYVEKSTKQAMEYLVSNELLLFQTSQDRANRWVATQLGKACLAASVPPADGLFLFEELQKARKCFVLDTELHVIYIVTPFNSASQIGQIDWYTYLDLWKNISESEQRVGKLVGVSEVYLATALKREPKQSKSLNIHKRFYTALALHDLVREVPLHTVCEKYGCSRGIIQGLQQTASTFAGMVTQFCKKLGWNCIELLVSQFQARLQFGVCRELLDLLRLPMVNGLRARSLFKEGITSVAELAVADELDVERSLYKALPFESEKEQAGEHENDAMRRNQMRTVFVTGKDGLTPKDAARMLVKQARVLVQNELGLDEMQWDKKNRTKQDSHIETSQAYNRICRNDLSLNNERHAMAKISNKLNNVLSKIQVVVESPKDTLEKIEDQNSGEEAKENLDDNVIVNCSKSTNASNASSIRLPIEGDIMESLSGNSNERTDDGIFDLASGNIDEAVVADDEELATKELTIAENRIVVVESENNDEIMDIEDEVFEDDVLSNKNSVDKVSDVGSINEEVAVINEPTVFTEITTRLSLSKDSTGKKSLTPSPNIFDDSLNIDSQELNILERNIVDLDSVVFNETDFSISASNRNDNNNGELQISNQNKIQLDKSKCTKLRSASQSLSTRSVIWEEETWSSMKEASQTKIVLNQLDVLKKMSVKPTFSSPKPGPSTMPAKNSEFTPPAPRRKSTESTSVDKTQTSKLQRLTERRFSSPSAGKSPIASLITYDNVRRMSSGSNKSEEDIIIASQTAEESTNAKKTRARLRLESIRMRTQKALEKSVIEESPEIVIVKQQQSITSQVGVKRRFSSSECHIKPFVCDDCTHSVIPGSDDEGVPSKRRNILSTSRRLLSRTQTIAKNSVEDKVTLDKLVIIDVSKKSNFNQFKAEICNRREIAIALGCEVFSAETMRIGTRIIGANHQAMKKSLKKTESGIYNDKKLCGIAATWGNNVYYLPFDNSKDLDRVAVKDRVSLLSEILSSPDLKVRCFNFKELYKTLYRCCGLTPYCKFLDSSTANWLLNPDLPEKSFMSLITEFFSDGLTLLQKLGKLSFDTAPGMDVKSTTSSEIRCCTEALLTWHLLDSLGRKLEEKDVTLLQTFKDIEMGAIGLIARMELSGLSVNLMALQELAEVIQQQLALLQDKAFALAGKKFNFSSSRSVAEVLKLSTGKKVSTNKVVLEQCNHPIAKMVISWRKLSTTFTKIVCPLLSSAERSTRIHGNCWMNTVTGRISMFDPNLQSVPRDFEVADNSFTISIRMAFIPAAGNVLLSADYCQLELRILAHYSKESNLVNILKKPGDVFKSIAARWYNTSELQVDDNMRQRAKQLIYGMIYGMGVKSLAETLHVEESEAREFQETFMSAYPGLKKWINETLERARKKGFVRTLMRRRRMLPGLNSDVAGEKGQAERQAINTKIQGSAADIVKKAMILIDEKMRAEFTDMPMVFPDEPVKRKLRRSREVLPPGAYLVLQLHDELLYEVNAADLHVAAKIITTSMEQAYALSVPLPVRVKSGPAWGDLSDYNFSNLA